MGVDLYHIYYEYGNEKAEFFLNLTYKERNQKLKEIHDRIPTDGFTKVITFSDFAYVYTLPEFEKFYDRCIKSDFFPSKAQYPFFPE